MGVATAVLSVMGSLEATSSTPPACYGGQAPAYLISMLIGGPSLLSMWLPHLSFEAFGFEWYGMERSIVAALVWGLVGWGLDRKLKGDVLIKRRPMRWLFFLLGFALSGILFIEFQTLHIISFIYTYSHQIAHGLSQFRLWTPGLIQLVGPLWATIASLYFGRKLWSLLRNRHNTEPIVTT